LLRKFVFVRKYTQKFLIFYYMCVNHNEQHDGG
jgi:hypothetical protein